MLPVLGTAAAETAGAIVAMSASLAAAAVGNGFAARALAAVGVAVIVSPTSLPATEEKTSSQRPLWVKQNKRTKQKIYQYQKQEREKQTLTFGPAHQHGPWSMEHGACKQGEELRALPFYAASGLS